MIIAEEKTRKRFPDRNNRENNRDNSDKRNFQTTDIRTGSVDLTTPLQWLARRRNFQGSEDLKTLRICIVCGTRKETTQQEIVESSLIDTQGKKKTRIKKKITRRKTKTTQRTKVSNSRMEKL
jgi:hypothetical protein